MVLSYHRRHSISGEYRLSVNYKPLLRTVFGAMNSENIDGEKIDSVIKKHTLEGRTITLHSLSSKCFYKSFTLCHHSASSIIFLINKSENVESADNST